VYDNKNVLHEKRIYKWQKKPEPITRVLRQAGWSARSGQAVQTWSFLLLFKLSIGWQFCAPIPLAIGTATAPSVGTL
jgi:hypothetical protein